MAWVTEYDLTWNSGSIYGDILIQRDGGSYQQPLTLARDTLEIKTHLPSWEEPVVRMNSSFTIINDLSDFYELLPLMTISNGQLRVVVTIRQPSSLTIFEGLMNPEAIDQQMLFNAALRLTRSYADAEDLTQEALVDKYKKDFDAPRPSQSSSESPI